MINMSVMSDRVLILHQVYILKIVAASVSRSVSGMLQRRFISFCSLMLFIRQSAAINEI